MTEDRNEWRRKNREFRKSPEGAEFRRRQIEKMGWLYFWWWYFWNFLSIEFFFVRGYPSWVVNLCGNIGRLSLGGIGSTR